MRVAPTPLAQRGHSATVRTLLCSALALWLTAGSSSIGAQATPGPESAAQRPSERPGGYKGPTVPTPTPYPWPEGTHLLLRSTRAPLAVHAIEGLHCTRRRIALVLDALEEARSRLLAMGWPPPYPDGGLGGTQGFDLLLDPTTPHGAEALPAGSVPAASLDAEVAWARVDPFTPIEALRSCVAQAYAEAVLWSLDPAEAAPWRQATAAWMAWRITGRPGCGDGVAEAQHAPWRAWLPEPSTSRHGEGGALLLELLDRYRGDGDGGLVRAMWDLTRQFSRTERATKLQARPRLWQVVEGMEAARGIEGKRRLEDLMVQIAVMRWTETGPGRPLPEVPRPPFLWRTSWHELPVHWPPSPPVEPFGSVYGWVDMEAEGERAPTLKAWLRGEWGVRWGMIALRTNASEEPLLPVRTTPRKEPKSFVRVVPIGPMRHVLLVAVNLSSRLPDLTLPDDNVRALRFIVDAEPRHEHR